MSSDSNGRSNRTVKHEKKKDIALEYAISIQNKLESQHAIIKAPMDYSGEVFQSGISH